MSLRVTTALALSLAAHALLVAGGRLEQAPSRSAARRELDIQTWSDGEAAVEAPPPPAGRSPTPLAASPVPAPREHRAPATEARHAEQVLTPASAAPDSTAAASDASDVGVADDALSNLEPRGSDVRSATAPAAVAGSAAVAGNAPAAGTSRPATLSVVPFGAGMTPPRLLTGPSPKYTAAALSARIEGKVLVRCTVDERGSTRDCTIIKPLRSLDAVVVHALLQSHFAPATYRGAPVAVKYLFTYEFRLP